MAHDRLAAYLAGIDPDYAQYAGACIAAEFNKKEELVHLPDTVPGIPKGALLRIRAGPSTATFTVKYVCWQKSFTCETSLEALMAHVELAWTSLKMRKYKLTLGKAEVVTDDVLKEPLGDKVICVEVMGRSFAEYKQTGLELEELAREVLGVRINGNTGAAKADDQFPPAEIGASTLIFESQTFDSLLDMLIHTLRAQVSVMSCVDDMREHSQREFISPVLALALLVARAVTSDSSSAELVPEYPLEGTVAWGPVDYVVLYRELAIIVVEAKRAQQLQLAWAQVIVEMSSLRERMLASLSSASNVKKRNHWQATELDTVATYAIVCTATCYRLLRYKPGTSGSLATLVSSNDLSMPLTQDTPAATMKAAASTLVLKLAQLIMNQMSIIDKAKHAHPLLSMCIPGVTQDFTQLERAEAAEADEGVTAE